MTDLTGFFAYPSKPDEIGRVVKSAVEHLNERFGISGLTTWEQNDIAGRFISDPIFSKIARSDYLIADVTKLNFNVTYEIGYAIGLGRRVLLVRNSSLKNDDAQVSKVGIFDTLGYSSYSNKGDLVEIIRGISDIQPLPFDKNTINRNSPVYVVLPKDKTDTELRITARIKKKARLQYRSFDPQEQQRLSGANAIEQVASSFGVVVPLLSHDRRDMQEHNMRGAFVAGLAAGMGKSCLLLQFGNDPIPLDYKDLVKSCSDLNHIDQYIADFVPTIMEQFQYKVKIETGRNLPWLSTVSLGQSAAENEFRELSAYYIEIDEYQRTRRGEVQVVTGRKGTGKTALFGQIRDDLRRERKRIVLDLKPEGYQLLEFMDVLKELSQGSREHVISAFWEYLLLLEIANKLIQKDREKHLYDQDIGDLYRNLESEYLHGEYSAEGDFAERMMNLTNEITKKYKEDVGEGEIGVLTTPELTEIIYRHNLGKLKKCITEYLQHKNGVWILFDNLDKGWPANGVTSSELGIVRGLLDAIRKLSISLRKNHVDCQGVIFIRNDVFELLIESMPDRGKVAKANLDWTDPEMLREMLRKRLVANKEVDGDPDFKEIWSKFCISHINGEETSQYLIDRSLMRPRGLLDIINHCRSHAVNLRHEKVTVEDILHGEEIYSTELIQGIDFEIRDVYPEAAGIIYELLEENVWIPKDRLESILESKTLTGDDLDRAIDFLIWYGVLGIVRDDGEPAYIYNMQYSSKKMRAIMSKQDRPTFQINPAFWSGLEIKQ